MLKLKIAPLLKHRSDSSVLPEGRLLINTTNAHSYNTALKDDEFTEALLKGGALTPDGASMVLASRWLRKESVEHIVGQDFFEYEMGRLNRKGGIYHFLGGNGNILKLIKEKAKTMYLNTQVKAYSLPYRPEFTQEENRMMIDAVNVVKPDLLWIGIMAPKQEKQAYAHLGEPKVNGYIGIIGAVLGFFAGTVGRVPVWWQEHGLEWLYRLIKEHRRVWRWYIIGNALFLWSTTKEKFSIQHKSMRLKGAVLTVCVTVMAPGIKAQYTMGTTGMMSIPTAGTQQMGTFMIGGNYLSKELNPFQYNSGNYFMNITLFPFLELNYRCILLKSDYMATKFKFNQQDRFSSVRIRPLKEGKYWLAVVIGGNDPSKDKGTNYLASVHGVATKNFMIGERQLAATAGYCHPLSKDKYISQDGIFGGLSYAPSFCKPLSVMAEYDSDGFNVGTAAKLWEHLSLNVFTREFRYISAGI